MLIYKILTAHQWEILATTGVFAGAPIDIADGYIHTSTSVQVQETADKHFAGQTGLVITAMRAEAYGEDLVWEASRGGALFPHIYNRPMLLSEVQWNRPAPLVDGQHQIDLA